MRSSAPRRAALTLVGLVLLCVVLVRGAALPPPPLPASAPVTEFSAERALRHVRAIAQRPHPVGSEDNARIREYLLTELRALGLTPEVQEATGVGTRYPEAGRVKNVLARLPGRTPGGPAVVLMAHYDGVGGGPAAGDDASGTAAILETLRALKAGSPLAHDVIALITDGEEAGLLGAAAFVREHPWAKDVGVTLNFEARGTRGRSYMFETGAGNLDVVRVLRSVPDVSATSLSVAVYRLLPNDTDLSEFAVLERPALNFAFTDGVDQYHTTYDDVAHLDAGSLQHHGSQALALARAFGDGPLPRPTTGDAVFFDVPVLGLIVYPDGWALPLAIVALALVLAAMPRVARRDQRAIRSIALGIGGAACAGGLAAVAATGAGNAMARAHVAMGWGGAPAFRGVYAVAVAMLALTVALACNAAARRWGSAAGVHLGALVVWSGIALLSSLRLPGASFFFVWPLLATAIAAHLGLRTPMTATGQAERFALGADLSLWVATIVAAAIVIPVVYAVSAVLLGAFGPGGSAAALLTALLAWLLAPHLDALAIGHPWRATVASLLIALGLFAAGAATVRSSPEHPTPSSVVYAMDADSGGAWLVARGTSPSPSVREDATGSPQVPAWLARNDGAGGRSRFAPVPRASIEPPSAVVISDSAHSGGRGVVLRVRAAPGTAAIGARIEGATVLLASVDGRPIDTRRYRSPVKQWRLAYAAPSDSGFTLGLTLAAPGPFTLELSARKDGLPSIPGVRAPVRSADVVTAHTGDATLVRRTIRFD